MEHLHAQGAARRVLLGDLVHQPGDGPLERAHLPELHVRAAHLFHPDQGFEVEHRGDQPFHVADAPAVDQVLEFLRV